MSLSNIKAGLLVVAALAVPSLSAAQDEAAAAPSEAETSAVAETTSVGTEGTTQEGEGDMAAEGEGGLSAAALLGYGVDFEDGDLNPFGFTLGARAGYTLPMKLYVGGTALFHVGGSEDVDVGGVKAESSLRMFQLGAEAGYDIAASSVILRPYLGLGLNMAFSSAKVEAFGMSMETDETNTDLYLNIGGAVLYPMGNYFIGGDIHLANVFADDTLTGLVFAATGGINL